MLVLGVLHTSTSDGRAISRGTGTASTRSPTSPTGRGAPADRTPARPPGKSVRSRGPGRHHKRHSKHKTVLRSVQAERSTSAGKRSAADPGVTIADFSFTPFTITVNVGGTVLWSNNGPSDHTATANNGSFNTGVLKKGQSASVTFHLPGTFDYHCAIHPFMHGTVVVLASSKTSTSSGSSSSGSSSGGGAGSNGGAGGSTGGSATGGASHSTGSSSSGTAAGTSAASSNGTLPLTGVSVPMIVALGLLLSGSGLLLRRLRRRWPG